MESSIRTWLRARGSVGYVLGEVDCEVLRRDSKLQKRKMRRRTVAVLAPCVLLLLGLLLPGLPTSPPAGFASEWPILYQCDQHKNRVVLRPDAEALFHLPEEADGEIRSRICLQVSSTMRAQGSGFRLVARGLGGVALRNRPWTARPIDKLDPHYTCVMLCRRHTYCSDHCFLTLPRLFRTVCMCFLSMKRKNTHSGSAISGMCSLSVLHRPC